MKIEYTVSGHESVLGKGWICYTRDLHSCSRVFDDLLFCIRRNKDSEFEVIGGKIEEDYKKKTSHAKAEILIWDDSIDICKPNKILPHIWISKI